MDSVAQSGDADLPLLTGPLERMQAIDARPVLYRPVRCRLGLGLLVHGVVVHELDAVAPREDGSTVLGRRAKPR